MSPPPPPPPNGGAAFLLMRGMQTLMSDDFRDVVPNSPATRNPVPRATIVICGVGMVGLRVMELLREREQAAEEVLLNGAPSQRFKIVAIGDEPHAAYNRGNQLSAYCVSLETKMSDVSLIFALRTVGLTQYFAHRSVERLLMRPIDWYKDNDVELFLNDAVTSINRSAKSVTTQSGKSVAYDHLVLATGSRAFVPPIPGSEHKGVFVYRTVTDVQVGRPPF